MDINPLQAQSYFTSLVNLGQMEAGYSNMVLMLNYSILERCLTIKTPSFTKTSFDNMLDTKVTKN